MRETGAGMAAAADWPTILHPRRPVRQEGAAPQRVTDGSQERGGGQGAVGYGRRDQDGPGAGTGAAAPRLSTETRHSGENQRDRNVIQHARERALLPIRFFRPVASQGVDMRYIALIVLALTLAACGSTKTVTQPGPTVTVTEPGPTVTETDTVTVTPTANAQGQATQISADGVYVIGTDIAGGTWHTSGGQQCYEATLASTDTNNIIDNNNFTGPDTVGLSGAKAFDVSGGCTWQQISS